MTLSPFPSWGHVDMAALGLGKDSYLAVFCSPTPCPPLDAAGSELHSQGLRLKELRQRGDSE